jgi:phosphate acetyltransferase
VRTRLPSALCCGGPRKPVNDLSRGALVSDIVNTVAITAVQAQGMKQAQFPTPATASSSA